jgi:hypothetical protein
MARRTRTIGYLTKPRLQGKGAYGPSCKVRGKLWKEELSSLTTRVEIVASLLTIITPSEGAEALEPQDRCLEGACDTATTGLIS